MFNSILQIYLKTIAVPFNIAMHDGRARQFCTAWHEGSLQLGPKKRIGGINEDQVPWSVEIDQIAGMLVLPVPQQQHSQGQPYPMQRGPGPLGLSGLN